MRHIRGLCDIKTHGTLAKEGRLVSVARDWHRVGKSGSSEDESWDGSVDRMVFKKSAKARRPSQDLSQPLVLRREIRATLIKQVQESMAEMEMFADEGVPGALTELQRLKVRLSQFESICEG